MKYRQLLATIGAVAIIAGACGGTSPTTAPPAATPEPGATAAPASAPPAGGLAAEQILRAYISDTDPETLTPYAAQDAVSLAVLGNVHRGLLHFDKDLNTVATGVAADLPVVSPDGKTLTFTIRDNAVYSDGSPIVGADFVRAARLTLDPLLANPYSYIICPIAGAEQLSSCGGPIDGSDPAANEAALQALGVTAPDEKTVVFTLGTPATYFATITTMWVLYPVKEEWVDPATGKFTEDAIIGQGSGPFVISSWERGSRITLVPNPNWYGDVKPTLTEVYLEIGGPLEQAFDSYVRGDLDVVQVTGTAIIKQIDDDPQLSSEAYDTPQLGITYYDYANCNDPNATAEADLCPDSPTADGKSVTANKNFRIALTQAVNKQEFIDVTFGGLGIPANSAVMPGIPGYDAEYDPYPYDPDAANAAMATALTELGITDANADGAVNVQDVGTLKFGYNCNAGHLPRVTYLAEAWRKTLNFAENQFDIKCTDFPTFLKERPEGVYNISRDGWGADFPHPVNQLNDLFRCGAGNNNSQYCNPQFDALMDQAGAEVDPVKAEETYKQAQRMLVDDAPVLWLRFAITRWMVKPYVDGVVITSSDHENPGDVFLETIKMMER